MPRPACASAPRRPAGNLPVAGSGAPYLCSSILRRPPRLPPPPVHESFIGGVRKPNTLVAIGSAGAPSSFAPKTTVPHVPHPATTLAKLHPSEPSPQPSAERLSPRANIERGHPSGVGIQRLIPFTGAPSPPDAPKRPRTRSSVSGPRARARGDVAGGHGDRYPGTTAAFPRRREAEAASARGCTPVPGRGAHLLTRPPVQSEPATRPRVHHPSGLPVLGRHACRTRVRAGVSWHTNRGRRVAGTWTNQRSGVSRQGCSAIHKPGRVVPRARRPASSDEGVCSPTGGRLPRGDLATQEAPGPLEA